VSASLEELRDVARGIYPAVLASHGLVIALESLADRAPVPVRLRVDRLERLPEPIEAAAYYVVSEALTNVGKHSQATLATVRVHRGGLGIVLDISDDGIGGTDPAKGSGLRGLTDRVEALGGELRISTSAEGGGTVIHAELPCP
jgi:signal transduction histidine kinase